MALKLLKINVGLQVKGYSNDMEDLKDRVYEALQIAIENDELEFEVLDDEDETELED